MKTVIVTNEDGEPLGTEEIIAAHTNGGTLHQAFSVVVMTPDQSKMLIQKRAPEKMLFAGVWANACCSHPRGEAPIEEEAARRLMEECGFTCTLRAHTSFVYKADDPGGHGTEYEYDTILIGEAPEDTVLNPDPSEISEMKWVAIDDLIEDMDNYPDRYAPWFLEILSLL